MDDKHHPRWVRRTVVQKGGLKGALVVVDVIQKHIEKRLRQLEALLMAPTVTIVVVTLGLFLR